MLAFTFSHNCSKTYNRPPPSSSCTHVVFAHTHLRTCKYTESRAPSGIHTWPKAYVVHKINIITRTMNQLGTVIPYYSCFPECEWALGDALGHLQWALQLIQELTVWKKTAFPPQKQCVVYLITTLCWWYVGFWAAGIYLRHLAKVHVPPASPLSAQHWSGTVYDSFAPTLLCHFYSTLGYSFVSLL